MSDNSNASSPSVSSPEPVDHLTTLLRAISEDFGRAESARTRPGQTRFKTKSSSEYGSESEIQSDSERIPESDPVSTLKETGKLCEIKRLYASPRRSTSGHYYTDWKPFSESAHNPKARNAAEMKLDEYAITHRQVQHGRNDWRTHSFIIYSPHILSTLQLIFEDYPRPMIAEPGLIIYPTSCQLIHKWDDILQAKDTEKDSEAKQHLELFISTLSIDMRYWLRRLDVIRKAGLIDFDDIVYLFRPGETMIQTEDRVWHSGVLIDIYHAEDSRGNTYYHVELDHVQSNGETFGHRVRASRVDYFEGARRLLDLGLFPLQFHPDQHQIREYLLQRGQKYVSLCCRQICHYRGIAIAGLVRTSKNFISERVIIDLKGFYRLEDKEPFELKRLESECLDESSPKAEKVDRVVSPRSSTSFYDNELLSMPPVQMGFLLQKQEWCQLFVDDIRPIQWSPNALERLILPRKEKTLITALINSSGIPSTVNDLVSEKGRGLILLFHGPPGVGKTFTAEAVSEHLKRPLYRVGMNDLQASDIENCLQIILKRCALWNAVLLIDEADVYLQARSADYSEQNEMVAVFLRLMESYSGILVLTTNRITAIDPAFESRIDFIFAYDDLTSDARVELWRQLLYIHGHETDISDNDIQEISRVELNGRQIKSAVKTALILANGEGIALNLAHLKTVIRARLRSMNLLSAKQTE